MPAKAPSLAQFLQNCSDITAASPHVALDHAAIHRLAPRFAAAAKAPSWSQYISDKANESPADVTRILFEMAMICAQQGGFIYPDDAGQPQKWNINGSGASAMLAKMAEIRAAGLLPGIDIAEPAKIDAALSPLLAGVPFAAERLTMFREFAAPQAYAALDALVQSARDANGTYRFDFDFINRMAKIFPQSFAADPFRKKAILSVLMTAAHGESKGVAIMTDAPIASDYVLPQVLEGLGILKLSNFLQSRLLAKAGFDEQDAAVRDLRAATITACNLLAQASGARPQDIDANLWLAGRDAEMKPRLKPAINVYTTWF